VSKTKSKPGPYALTRPCAKCPFRNDIPGYLSADRVAEIEDSLIRSEFPCHETTRDDEDDSCSGHYTPKGGEIHCAGALILLEKLERPSQMMRISERLGFYDRRKLDMDAPVFDSFEDMMDAQPE
jgi:hypothetical protein